MTKPLWEAMADAFIETAALAPWSDFSAMFARCKAAEIRAIAAWIEQRQVEDYLATLPRPHHTDIPKVIGWLADEADRAENHNNQKDVLF